MGFGESETKMGILNKEVAVRSQMLQEEPKAPECTWLVLVKLPSGLLRLLNSDILFINVEGVISK